jgi:hypothetical protein
MKKHYSVGDRVIIDIDAYAVGYGKTRCGGMPGTITGMTCKACHAAIAKGAVDISAEITLDKLPWKGKLGRKSRHHLRISEVDFFHESDAMGQDARDDYFKAAKYDKSIPKKTRKFIKKFLKHSK